MDRSSALARLGLTGAEDGTVITRAYGEQLSAVQEKLVAAQTEADRLQHQTKLSELVEAYEFVTESGRYTKARGSDSAAATEMRGPNDAPAAGAGHDTFVRMEPGAVLSSRLEIGALLGQGGMGNVYAARDRLKDEDVAIKVLRQDLLFSTAAKDRFLAEAKVSCNLSHPNIVRVYDVGLSGNYYYFSMERLKGHTLRQRMEAYSAEKRDFSITEVSDIAHQLIDALRYAHRYIVHRDIKPENIWLAEDGTVKLMDFGIARAYSSSQLTQTGMTLGTAYYMAPEQRIAAKEVDWRADQYALGVVLYEMLTGTIPMGAVKSLDKARRDLPPRYASALMRAMSPKPEDRWPSLNDLLAEMEAPVRKPMSSAAVLFIALAFAAVASAGGYYYFVKGRTAVTEPVASAGTDPVKGSSVPDSSASSSQSPTGEPPAEPPKDPPQATLPPVSTADSPAASEPQPEPEQAAVPPPQKPAVSKPVKVASVDQSGSSSRRQQCIAQCERDDGECRSINRRGKQDCMRAVAFNGTGSRISSAAGADCSFYGAERCQYAGNRDTCMNRITTRYTQCQSTLNGSVASRRQDCEDRGRDSDRMCLDQMRDCRTSCE
jgi:serine/threonine protein kinase